MLEELEQVLRVGVHFVTVPRLAGSAVTATIVGNAPIAFGGEEKHLLFPVVRAQRPAMRKGNDRAGLGTPVLVVDLCAVTGCE